MIAKAWLATAGLLVSACATGTTARTKAEPDPAPSTMLICEVERPTGTMIRTRVCRTREIAEKNRRDAEEILRTRPVQIEKGD